MLTDLGSRNGTLVDGEFVSEIELEHHHEIRVGDAIFKFVEAGAESYARYRIDGARARRRAGERHATAPFARSSSAATRSTRIAGALERVAKSELSVVILGESGTGKEVVAQQLHDWSGRRGPFQAVNCAAIPATLLESELFGYKRGAFSGADRDKPGLVRAADGGTLFLDEIGDMPLEAQAKLLRVLQSQRDRSRSARRRPSASTCASSARRTAISTKLQREGTFRGDLFARLNEYAVRAAAAARAQGGHLPALPRAARARTGGRELGLTFPFMPALSTTTGRSTCASSRRCIKRASRSPTAPRSTRSTCPTRSTSA